MCLTDKWRKFANAYGDFINSERSGKETSPLVDDLYTSMKELQYCAPSAGKVNMANDFQTFAKDVKKATQEAKKKVK